MKILLLPWLCILLLLGGCWDKKQVEIEPPLPLMLDTVWSLTLGAGIPLEITPQGDVIYTTKYPMMQNEIIYKIEGHTGKQLFQWNDYLNPQTKLYRKKYFTWQDRMLISFANDLHCLNTETGNTLWKYRTAENVYASDIVSNGNGQFYQATSKENFSLVIYSINIETGAKTLSFSLRDSTLQHENIRVNLMHYAKNGKGEDCLFLDLDYTSPDKFPESYARQVCCNLSTQKIDWEYNQFSLHPYLSANIGNLLYVVNRLDGTFNLQCFVMDNGRLVWEKYLGETGINDMYPQQNSLVIAPFGADDVKAFNSQNGQEEWRFPLSSPTYDDFGFTNESTMRYKHYMFSVYKRYLLILNMQTGAVVYYKPIGFWDSGFGKGVAINEEKRLLYVQDVYTLRCYRLPKEVVF